MKLGTGPPSRLKGAGLGDAVRGEEPESPLSPSLGVPRELHRHCVHAEGPGPRESGLTSMADAVSPYDPCPADS